MKHYKIVPMSQREKLSSLAVVWKLSKNYVGSMKERSVHTEAKVNRNQSFRKIGLDKSDNNSMLICETDDFVHVSDCST